MPAPTTKAERDAALDALQKAVDKWAEKEKTRLENEVKYMRAVLKGRGTDGAVTSNLDLTSELLQAEIDEFLLNG